MNFENLTFRNIWCVGNFVTRCGFSSINRSRGGEEEDNFGTFLIPSQAMLFFIAKRAVKLLLAEEPWHGDLRYRSNFFRSIIFYKYPPWEGVTSLAIYLYWSTFIKFSSNNSPFHLPITLHLKLLSREGGNFPGFPDSPPPRDGDLRLREMGWYREGIFLAKILLNIDQWEGFTSLFRSSHSWYLKKILE